MKLNSSYSVLNNALGKELQASYHYNKQFWLQILQLHVSGWYLMPNLHGSQNRNKKLEDEDTDQQFLGGF